MNRCHFDFPLSIYETHPYMDLFACRNEINTTDKSINIFFPQKGNPSNSQNMPARKTPFPGNSWILKDRRSPQDPVTRDRSGDRDFVLGENNHFRNHSPRGTSAGFFFPKLQPFQIDLYKRGRQKSAWQRLVEKFTEHNGNPVEKFTKRYLSINQRGVGARFLPGRFDYSFGHTQKYFSRVVMFQTFTLEQFFRQNYSLLAYNCDFVRYKVVLW